MQMMAQFGPSGGVHQGLGAPPPPFPAQQHPERGGGVGPPRMQGPPHHNLRGGQQGPPTSSQQGPPTSSQQGPPPDLPFGKHAKAPSLGQPPQNRPPAADQPLTLRLILSRDQASYLFGFDGVLLAQLRQQTGANIALSEGNAPEKVLSINGGLELIFKAFSLVCRKLWDFISGLAAVGGQPPPLVIRLSVPASQCGQIIGKQGSKIKEIRDITGSAVQVGTESLPDSTERCVEISGTGESCLQTTYHICCILQESPLKGEHVPYWPKAPLSNLDEWKPVFLCGDKAYVIDGSVARPAPHEMLRRELAKTPLGALAETGGSVTKLPQKEQVLQQQRLNPVALMQAISNAHRNNGGGPAASPQSTKEMRVATDAIGRVIGKGGSKIDEIRRLSAAKVHIVDEESSGADGERIVAITGSEESILLAQFLVQSSIEMGKERWGGGAGLGDIPPSLPPPPVQFGIDATGIDKLPHNPEAMSALHQMNNHMPPQQPPFGHGGRGRGGGGGPFRGGGGDRLGGGGGFHGRGVGGRGGGPTGGRTRGGGRGMRR